MRRHWFPRICYFLLASFFSRRFLLFFYTDSSGQFGYRETLRFFLICSLEFVLMFIEIKNWKQATVDIFLSFLCYFSTLINLDINIKDSVINLLLPFFICVSAFFLNSWKYDNLLSCFLADRKFVFLVAYRWLSVMQEHFICFGQWFECIGKFNLTGQLLFSSCHLVRGM